MWKTNLTSLSLRGTRSLLRKPSFNIRQLVNTEACSPATVGFSLDSPGNSLNRVFRFKKDGCLSTPSFLSVWVLGSMPHLTEQVIVL